MIGGDLDDIHVSGLKASGYHNVSHHGIFVLATVLASVRYHVHIVISYHVRSTIMMLNMVILGGCDDDYDSGDDDDDNNDDDNYNMKYYNNVAKV